MSAAERAARQRADWIAEQLAAAPPLTQEQIKNLRRLLVVRRRSA